jgi:hypothetical protein
MRQRELARLIKSLGHLTHAQRQKVSAELAATQHQAASVTIIEGGVGEKPSCPHKHTCARPSRRRHARLIPGYESWACRYEALLPNMA